MKSDLAGKYALVTGGRRGIGKAFVKTLVQNWCKVAVVSQSPDATDLLEEMEDLYGTRIPYYQVDLSIREERQYLISKVIHEFGRLDILINCAGYQKKNFALNTNPSEWDKTLEVNLTAPFELCKDAAVQMVKQGGGKIINVASIASFQPARQISAYAVAKSGLVMLTECLAREWGQYGINVNAIAPGFIQTDMLDLPEERKSEIVGRIPLGRLGVTDDLTGAMLFLCSDASKYITGQTIVVDGGWLTQ
jgi:2-dehydro-3-deoxy-D-gluconate 5-dehydrogenase